MRPYAAILSARLRMLLQYRAAALAGIATQVFWGFIRIMIFEAFYRSTTMPQPMSLQEVIDYVWLGQAALVLLMVWADPEVSDMVRTGSVAYELVRPIDLFAMWYWKSVASRAAPALLRFLPLMTAAVLFFGLRPPASAEAGLAFAAALLAALLLSAAIMTLMTLSTLWTVTGDGIQRLMPVLIWVLSGIIVPIPLFPEWAQAVAHALPFGGLMDMPARVYMGHIPVEDALTAVGRQLAWVVALVGLGKALAARGSRRLVVHGG